MMRPVERPQQKIGALERFGRAIDRVVMAFNPERGEDRIRARARGAILSAAYKGADRGRLQGGWTTSRGSADRDLVANLARETMVERSRELSQNDPHAASIFQVLCDLAIGTGIRAQARARPGERTGLSKAQAREWNQALDDVFLDYAGRTDRGIDATGQNDFYGLQRLIGRNLFVDGESFQHAHMVTGELGRDLATSVELVEPERVVSPAGDSKSIHDGIEIGARGQAIAYHVLPEHPGGLVSSGRFDPKRYRRFRKGRRNMVHLFRRNRPGQTRGVPILAPALGWFDHLRSYLEYELVAARINSSIACFVKRTGGGDEPHISFDDDDDHFVEDIKAGAIEYLGDGEEIQPFNPNRPGTTFDPYVVRMLRAICAAANLPYNLVARDGTGINYTTSRFLSLEARRGIRVWQELLICGSFAPWRELVIVEAYARNLLPRVKGFGDPRIRRALLRAAWIPPAAGFVNPVQEIQASRDAITAGLSTRSDEVAGNGRDFEETARINAGELRVLFDLEEEFKLPAGSLTAGAKPDASNLEDPERDEGDDQAENDDDVVDQDQDDELEDEDEDLEEDDELEGAEQDEEAKSGVR